MHSVRIGLSALLVGVIAACSQESLTPEPVTNELSEAGPAVSQTEVVVDATTAAEIGTPMEERVAVLGLLNKRNNSSQDIELRPGETQRLGNIRISLRACERTAPWEMQRETGAFVQVDVLPRGSSDFERIFSGWLFKQMPSLNVVEHPVYDVWVKDCMMSFPGEE